MWNTLSGMTAFKRTAETWKWLRGYYCRHSAWIFSNEFPSICAQQKKRRRKWSDKSFRKSISRNAFLYRAVRRWNSFESAHMMESPTARGCPHATRNMFHVFDGDTIFFPSCMMYSGDGNVAFVLWCIVIARMVILKKRARRAATILWGFINTYTYEKKKKIEKNPNISNIYRVCYVLKTIFDWQFFFRLFYVPCHIAATEKTSKQQHVLGIVALTCSISYVYI